MNKDVIKPIEYLIPIVIIMVFLIIMHSATLFKGQDVGRQIDELKSEVTQEHWISAEAKLSSLDQDWQETIKRIQFGAEREDLNQLNRNIARLKGLIQAEDKNGALAELAEAKYHWSEIGK